MPTRKISKDFSELVEKANKDFDVVIIGSGYGAASAAYALSRKINPDTNLPISICILERGNEYLQGMFPSHFSELPRHVRYALPTGNRNNAGLFDLRFSSSVTAVLANGLGGGSLINAGVMEEPPDKIFERWPAELKEPATRDLDFPLARELLGAVEYGEGQPDAALPKKFNAFRNLNTAAHRRAHVTIAQHQDVDTKGGFKLDQCINCGDCATGCNHNAKFSLDVGLLARAERQGNCKIFTGATVINLAPTNDARWRINTVYTDEQLRTRHGATVPIIGAHVIVAAGTLGSVEILKRSELELSPQLGFKASTNGDSMIVDYETHDEVNAVADEAKAPQNRAIGPTITGVMNLAQGPAKPDIVVEEMAVPAALRQFFREIYATTNLLHGLGRRDDQLHHSGFPARDRDDYSLEAHTLPNTALYAVMGEDGGNGASASIEVELDEYELDPYRDGIASMVSDSLRDDPLFAEQLITVKNLTQETGGRNIANPAWQLLPDELQYISGFQHGALLTVHPLGGCSMADEFADGVVDAIGRVHAPVDYATDHYEGLAVLDGSIIPGALGTNPALTITALSLRAAQRLAVVWQFLDPVGDAAEISVQKRAIYKDSGPGINTRVDSEPTQVSVLERLEGPVRIRPLWGLPHLYRAEVTLRFESIRINELIERASDVQEPTLIVDPDESTLRIYSESTWQNIRNQNIPDDQIEKLLEANALFHAPLSGTLEVFHRHRSWWLGRVIRAGYAWFLNRGFRDIYQGADFHPDNPSVWKRIINGVALASHAGEKRRLSYHLTVGEPRPGSLEFAGRRIRGIKTFTYNRKANPWNQLMKVKLLRFPGLCFWTSKRWINLDLPFLARSEVPLFEVTHQQNQTTAIGDLLAFLSYLTRLMLGIHLWTFRKPDEDPRRDQDIERLPQNMPNLPEKQTVYIPFGPDHAELSRFEPSNVDDRPPVLMIHGYSASGNTFAHHAVEPNAARYFTKKGRDVWILDMRTSAAFESATNNWTFEEVGTTDIPRAIQEIINRTGKPSVDIFAHCMGSAMLSMAVLSGVIPEGQIHKLAMTQVAPLLVFSPANIFRSFIFRYIREFLPIDDYSFRPTDGDSRVNTLLDRFLNSIPYPKEEYNVENPPLRYCRATPWVRTRHRMDALYGRDFSVRNMPYKVLKYIDDLFGPLSFKTVLQTIHFARFKTITNVHGENEYVSRDKVQAHWRFPTLSVHGEENGLMDVNTVHRMDDVFRQRMGRDYRYETIPGAGHQDCLIGHDQRKVFDVIYKFFENPDVVPTVVPATGFVAYPPWMGPIVTIHEPALAANEELWIRLGTRPMLDFAAGVVLLPIADISDPPDAATIASLMTFVLSPELQAQDWVSIQVPPPQIPAADESLLVMVLFDEPGYLANVATNSPSYFIHSNGEGVRLDKFWEPVDRSASELSPILWQGIAQATAISISIEFPKLENLINLPVNMDMDLHDLDPDVARAAVAVEQAPEEPAAMLIDGLVPVNTTHLGGNTVLPVDAPRKFAFGSCQFPGNLVDRRVAYASYRRLDARITTDLNLDFRPDFLVLTGDQVYLDVSAGLYDPSDRDSHTTRYYRPYVRWLRNRHVRDVLRRLPSFMMLDDHEIDNNWEPVDVDAPNSNENVQFRKEGRKAYFKFQRDEYAGNEPRFSFRHNGVNFFVMDTRSERARRTAATFDTARMISDEQLAELKQWLQDTKGPKFVVSPAMLLPRHEQMAQHNPQSPERLHSDRWEGYPRTMEEVLSFIALHDIKPVVFLSGDEHMPCSATITIKRQFASTSTKLWSIHTSPAYAPYKFANSEQEKFRAPDGYKFPGHEIKVLRADFFPEVGNSFTYFRLESNAAGTQWTLHYEYDKDPFGPYKILLV